MKTTKELLGLRIKEIRKLKSLQQDKLADMIGIDSRHINRIENGHGFPSLETLDAIGKALGVELKALFEFDHLEGPTERVKEITRMAITLGEEDQKKAYRIMKVLANEI